MASKLVARVLTGTTLALNLAAPTLLELLVQLKEQPHRRKWVEDPRLYCLSPSVQRPVVRRLSLGRLLPVEQQLTGASGAVRGKPLDVDEGVFGFLADGASQRP